MAIHHPLNHRNRSIHPKPIDLYRFSSTFKTPVGCDRDGRAGRFLSPCRASIHKALENPQKSLRSRETPSSSPCLSDFSPPQESASCRGTGQRWCMMLISFLMLCLNSKIW